ncbi:MAG: hypothetical protein P8188_13875 [Gemmatimonadota bacterium]|jgi:hypothetical protein
MRHGTVIAILGLAAIGLSALPGEIRAQVVWDGPMLVSPNGLGGWGAHVVDPHPGNGIGALVTWRSEPAPEGLGFRVGVVEGFQGDAAVLGGVDLAGAIYRMEDQDFDLDIAWFLGAGLAIDEEWTVSLPAGITVGWSFTSQQLDFRPYVAPRVMLDAFPGDDRVDGEDGLDLGFAVELGADLAWDPRFGIRAGGSFGDREALSVGVVFPG